MIYYGVPWKDSKSRIIYQANEHSDSLMEYLENQLSNQNLFQLGAERPFGTPGRRYGAMLYYYQTKPNRILLTSAPRRKRTYIHVELTCNVIDRETIVGNGLTLGNHKEPKVPDLKLYSQTEVDTLISLLKHNNYKLG